MRHHVVKQNVRTLRRDPGLRRLAAGRRVVIIAAGILLALAGQSSTQTVQTPPAPAPAPVADDLADRALKAYAVTHTFWERYKLQLTTALKDGPVAAVGSYAEFATEIASSLSEETPFEITRTAVRVRNADNAPDAWELANLENFDKQIKGGIDPKKIEAYSVITTKEGQRLFRYMRPIMMGEQCLACHGSDVKGDVKAEIARTYPDDKALGYNLGEMRGAFSLVQQLD